MYLNQFSVRVVGGNEIAGGYVEMEHGANYSLQMRNDRGVRCDARVEVDGKHVGTWRVDPHRSINIERPSHDDGKFTFYKLGTLDGEKAGLNGSDPNLGLIRVTFTPEHEPRPIYSEPVARAASSWDDNLESAPRTFGATRGAKTLGAGGTGLSGHSHQQFGTANQINHDYSQQTVIHLRLVAHDKDEPRPLTSFSTPVPPRVQ